MMEYKLARYNEYKDSEINCLGEVPRHWETKRIQDITTRVGDGLHSTPNYVDSSGYHFINGNNLVEGRILITENTKCISKIEFEKYKIRISNRAILLSINGTIGNLALYRNENIILGKSAAYINLKNMTNRRYIYFFLQSVTVLNFFATTFAGTTINNLSLNTLRTTDIPFPPISEQKAIADYLDTKTEQIDQKIDLLTQKATQYGKLKQSLINETVTRGLDKTVVMKDSGVEWIGDVPEHWEVKRLKEIGFLFSGLSGKKGDDFTDEHEFSSNFIPFVNIANNQYISTTEMKKVIVYPNENQNKVKQNDLFFLMSSENYEDIGKSALLKVDIGDTYLNSFCRGFRFTRKDIVANFVNYLLTSVKCRNSISVEGKGFTRINLKIEKINDLLLIVPPLPEQQAISDYLDAKTAHIDRIIETINTQINKLNELRKTLINDVVTGKIKVAAKGEAV